MPDALLLSAGQLERVLVTLLGEAHLIQQLDGLGVRLVLRPLLHDDGTLGDVLQHRLVRKQIVGLEHKAALRAVLPQLVLGDRLGEVDLDLADPDDACIRDIQRIERAQQCRLAGPGRADDRRRRPLRDGERDTFQYFVVSEGLAHTLGDDPVFTGLGHRATYLSSRRSYLFWANESTKQMIQ